MSFRTTDKNDRVMIFLDLANITFGLKDYKGLENCRIDHEGLVNMLVDGRKVSGAMAFDTNEYFENKRCITSYLSRIGYKIVGGHMDDDEQKEVDVALATEMIMHAVNDHYDVAVLLSGDRDFIPAISAVQSLGKKVEVASFAESTSKAVKNVSDRYVNIGSLPVVEYFEPDKVEYTEDGDDLFENSDGFVDVFDLIDEAAACQEVD